MQNIRATFAQAEFAKPKLATAIFAKAHIAKARSAEASFANDTFAKDPICWAQGVALFHFVFDFSVEVLLTPSSKDGSTTRSARPRKVATKGSDEQDKHCSHDIPLGASPSRVACNCGGDTAGR